MCTDFVITGTDGGKPVYVNGHSMEFALPLDSAPFVCARRQPFESPGPNAPGLKWTTKYGYVGISTALPLLKWFVMDGMNEAGLSTASMWLPGSTYPSIVETPSNALWVPFFVDWVLGSFATVDEVEQALTAPGGVEIWAPADEDKYDPLHWPIHDAAGNSIVVEFTNGKLNIYTNPYHVLTNGPTFPAQCDNLGNYTSLQSAEVVSQLAIQQNGHGSGLRGIPGDPLPTSRFVRMFYLKGFAQAFATQQRSSADTRNLAFHLLDTVDIPLGITFDPGKPSGENSDFTQWDVVKDLTNRVLEYRRYGDLMRLSVDLKEIDFDAVPSGPIQVPATIDPIDVTPVPVYCWTAQNPLRCYFSSDPSENPGPSWTKEMGVAFTAFPASIAGASPVREYSAGDAASTGNPKRFNYTPALPGPAWTDDDKAPFGAYLSQVGGTVPIFQYHTLLSGGGWNLFYSRDGNLANAPNPNGWVKDGIAFYVYPPSEGLGRPHR